MTIRTKVFIGVGAAVLSVFVAAFIGLLYYIGSDEEYARQYQEAIVEGNKFGQQTNQAGCISEGFARLEKIPQPGFKTLAVQDRFIRDCLEVSKPTEKFCDGVPMVAVEDWAKVQCKLIGKDYGAACFTVFDAKSTYCSGL